MSFGNLKAAPLFTTCLLAAVSHSRPSPVALVQFRAPLE